MKLIKTKDKFLLVSDEEIKEGDTVICGIIIGKYQRDLENNTYDILCKGNCYPFSVKSDLTKIISENPDFSDLKEEECIEIGWVDIEKLLLDYFKDEYNFNNYWKPLIISNPSLIEVFKKAQSLNDKMFSLEDIIQAINLSREKLPYNFDGKSTDYKHSYNDIIQSLQQTSWDVEVEMEVFTETVGTSEFDFMEQDSVRPKITNNSIKILKIL